MAGRVVGISGAAWFLVIASREAFDLAFGVLVLFGVVLSLLGLQVRPTRTGATIAGALSGLMGTISSIGGPPMALLYQDSGVARLRGTLSGFFVVGTTLSIVVLAAIGRYGRDEVVLSLLLTPPVIVGFYSAAPLRRLVNEGSIRPLVLGLSSCSAIVVLWRVWQQAGG
jgi:uncharacterized membrane protein YfcA